MQGVPFGRSLRLQRLDVPVLGGWGQLAGYDLIIARL